MPWSAPGRGRFAVALGVAVVMMVGGCAEAPYRSATQGPGTVTIPPDERRPLWERITEEPYEDWKVAPGYQVPRDSDSPHGPRVQTFLNETAATAREQAAASWPDGSIIVADFLDDHSIVRVAAMEKRRGAWYFALWTPNGRPLPVDDQGDCSSCHANGTDGTLGVRIGR